MNTLPAPPRMPEIIPPPSTIVQVSPAQVWSAAAQNIVIALVIGGLMYAGKIGEELGLLALSAVAGIDLVGRFKSKSSAAAALAVGASTFMSKLPHTLVALALGTALIGGCGSSNPFAKPPQSAEDVAVLITTGLDTALWACSQPVLSREELAALGSICQDLARAKAKLQGPALGIDAGSDEDGGAE